MTLPSFDRQHLRFNPLSERPNRVLIERDALQPGQPAPTLDRATAGVVAETAERIRAARQAARPVVLAFGAHTIKNGLAPILIALMERGWLTHLATNGAGIIHDWEFAWQGASSEDVAANVAQGRFGMWEETGRTINLALLAGAAQGLGYGEAVGSIIEREGLRLPDPTWLQQELIDLAVLDPNRAAALADLLWAMRKFELPAGFIDLPHPFKQFSVQAAAVRLGVPFTGHPMFGHDIIYLHPLNHGAALGRCAERDWLAYVAAIRRLEGGVYLSLGSAVMSPMIFEKALSMAQNVALQAGRKIENHFMLVVDLAASDWDWSAGEPPHDHPAYYARHQKTFSRMGGHLRHARLDNRDFLLTLWHALEG